MEEQSIFACLAAGILIYFSLNPYYDSVTARFPMVVNEETF